MKKSVLGAAFANISNEPQKTAKADVFSIPDRPVVADDERPLGVMLRLMPGDHRAVSTFARDKGMSIQELAEFALSAVLKSEGLAPLVGMPRPRGRRSRI